MFYEKSQVFFYKHTFCTLTAVHYNDIRQHKKAHHSLQPFPAKSDVPLRAIPHKERLTTLHAICLQISRHIRSEERRVGKECRL